MPDLRFEVIGADVAPYAAIPTLLFHLRVANTAGEERIHSALLRCQIRIAAIRRRYSPEAKARLVELFGEPERWRETVRSFLWTNVTAALTSFTGATTIDLPVPCSYDFEVAVTKYFDALDDGEIPLLFLFSGTVFYEGPGGALQVAQISWEQEAEYRLPVSLWKELMARYYPNTAWIHLDKDLFDRLQRYKVAHGLPTWEETVSRLLAAETREASV